MWRGVSSGPDWTDVRLFMKALEESYQVSISVMLVPAGRRESTALRCSVCAMWVALEEVGSTGVTTVDKVWPSKEHKTLEGVAMNCLYTMEKVLMGKRQEQAPLWD